MKILISENSYLFHVQIEPENVAECSLLLRMAIDIKKEVPKIITSFNTIGTINSSITLRKKQDMLINNWLENKK